ncbi:MAG TPA: glycosyltransferase family 4 protein [Gemmatimonadaceae bacterium]|nr:glycosyltransferase family 4 protein [Gemmatimonadaceae bacterium]
MSSKVIFVPYLDGFGGVERLVLTLSKFLHARGVAHVVLCFRNPMKLEEFATWPLTVSALQCARNALAETTALRSWMAKTTNSSPAESILAFDLKGALFAGLGRGPFVLHLTDPPSLLRDDVSKDAITFRHGYGERRSRTLARIARAEIVHRLNTRGVRRARAVVVMTHLIATEIRHLYGVDPVIIRPGVENAARKHVHNSNASRFRILSVCRLEESKRLSWVIQGLAELERSESPLSRTVDWIFDLVGAGPAQLGLENLAKTLGLSDRIVFHGRVTDAELERRFQDAALFVMPAVQGYGLPALEALIRGVPVVVHERSGVSEILRDTPWVELLNDDDGADVARGLKRLTDRVLSGELVRTQPPDTPVADRWARQICAACGWNEDVILETD